MRRKRLKWNSVQKKCSNVLKLKYLLIKINVLSLKSHENQAELRVNDADINDFIAFISDYDLNFYSEIKFTLEDYFMKFYDRNSKMREEASKVPLIEINNMTKDYGDGRGIFDVSLSIEKGKFWFCRYEWSR